MCYNKCRLYYIDILALLYNGEHYI